MPKRTDIDSILVVGAGPIVIGQAAEFDYSGTQAVKALKGEGYRVVLVNSNPATIMTDPEFADATYIEPITPEMLRLIIEQERPDALLPTVGGQTGINAAVALAEAGTLRALGVELLGARLPALQVAEDRLLFKETMERHGLVCPTAGLASSLEEAHAIAAEIGSYPLLIRPSFTLGGSGGGIVFNAGQFEEKVAWGIAQSPVGTVLVEESVIGWKEFELEVMRDRADNFVVVCSIENVDPMGVHTGDSITVAPAMTLTDREYQRLRDQAKAVMRAVGVETGGSNVQFAVNPADGRVLVIEMNPRVSRSSALASKATGFPIAKIAALLAVGYTLDEIPNTITRTTMAAFEPSIDYVVTKLPRWAFEKFPGTDPELGPQMKSVGEAMSIGRTFKESLLKGLASLELDHPPYPTAPFTGEPGDLRSPRAGRIFAVWAALRAGHPIEAIHDATGIDPWWLAQLGEVVELEGQLAAFDAPEEVPEPLLRRAKRWGLTDGHLAHLLGAEEEAVRAARLARGIVPTYHVVDTCAAEFESHTPYLYSSYERETEAPPSDRPKVIILGNGPNRIGQGIEFDYACVHAAFTARRLGYEAIMINCNPETVSTDYDTSDRLYFEPLTAEHVLNVVAREGSGDPGLIRGVIVQFGGQTPLKLAAALEAAGVPILGTPTDAIDRAEERGRFGAMLAGLDIPYPTGGTAATLEEAKGLAKRIGYPVVVRPSYVLGGRAMAIIYTEAMLERYMGQAVAAAAGQTVLVDQYLEDAYEVDVDALGDGQRVVIGGVLQHIEEAGVHSGDSAMVMPPYKVSLWHLNAIRDYTEQIGRELGVVGLMNIQFAIKDDVVYVLEVNPRASRTVPFVSKATGVPLAKLATRVVLGETLEAVGLTDEPPVDGFFVKEAVIPFDKFPGADALLGPEMRSTGEVMGHAPRFGHAFAKAQIGAGNAIPDGGTVLVSVNDFDKSAALKLARDMQRMGLGIIATRGTANFFIGAGLRDVATVNKVSEGTPNVVDLIGEGRIDLIISTPLGQTARDDGALIRRAAIRHQVPLVTTLSAAQAAVGAIRATREQAFAVRSLQAHYARDGT